MAKEKVVEYETVEKTDTITVCDHCGRTENDIDVIDIAINPKVRKKEEWNIVEVHDDAIDAQESLRDINYNRVAPNIRNGLNQTGVARTYKTVDAEADASADLCASCIAEFFDVDIEPEHNVEGVEINGGDVTIDVTEEITRNYPQIDLHREYSLIAVILWPFLILDGILFYDLDSVEENKVFLESAFGGILWLGSIITFLSFVAVV